MAEIQHSTCTSSDWSLKERLVQDLLAVYFITFMATSRHHYLSSQFMTIRNKFNNT